MTDIPYKQARLHIKFANLRNGILSDASDRQVAKLLDATQPQPWRARPPRDAWPRSAGFAYPPRGASVEEAAELADQRVLFSVASQRVTLGSATQREARTTVNQVARYLAGLGFRYYRTLGWGGEGIAALFYVVDPTGQAQRVVAKMALRESSGFDNEQAMSLKFRGRDHILQRRLGPDLAPANGEVQVAIDEALRPAENWLMLFEFAEYGSLAKLLKRVSEPVSDEDDPLGLRADRGRPLPDRALMHIFHCLATACNDLAAPADVGPGGIPTPVVHFDFEPSNLLFGGAEAVVQPEHTLMPILKVSDFGLASTIPTNLNDDASTDIMWSLRWRAKARWFLPEQFSQDWDFVDRHPLVDNIDTYGKVAGHYGPASNVYHVGLALWSCITGVWPQLPDNSRLVPNPLPRVDGAVWWTWSAEILDDTKYGNVDRQIRETVMACLAEEPGQRLDSQRLLAWCNEKTEQLRQVPGSTDADLYNWAAANLAGPPEPTAQTPVPDMDPNNPSNDQFDPFDPGWAL